MQAQQLAHRQLDNQNMANLDHCQQPLKYINFGQILTMALT